MDKKNNMPESKNKMGQNNPPKKEETVQAGKERMDTDGNTHSRDNSQQHTFENPKKNYGNATFKKAPDKPGFQTPMKKPDVSSGQVKQH